jgi:hypothetical protein
VTRVSTPSPKRFTFRRGEKSVSDERAYDLLLLVEAHTLKELRCLSPPSFPCLKRHGQPEHFVLKCYKSDGSS